MSLWNETPRKSQLTFLSPRVIFPKRSPLHMNLPTSGLSASLNQTSTETSVSFLEVPLENGSFLHHIRPVREDVVLVT